MSELEIGDRILVATKIEKANDASGISSTINAVYDTVYAFGHSHPTMEALFLQIRTAASKKLEMTPDHMVLLVDNAGSRIHVPASHVQIGSNLVLSSGDLDVVREIHTVQRFGVYAPFTYSGTLVVDDLRVSSYVAFQGSDVLVVIGGYRTFLRYHWLAYMFETPHRIASQLGISSESYSEEGISTWVHLPLKVTNWLVGA
jgi:hypothetical protein